MQMQQCVCVCALAWQQLGCCSAGWLTWRPLTLLCCRAVLSCCFCCCDCAADLNLYNEFLKLANGAHTEMFQPRS
jgi:hypothetical protein